MDGGHCSERFTYSLLRLIFTILGRYYNLHFIDEQTETQRFSSLPQSTGADGAKFQPRHLYSEPLPYSAKRTWSQEKEPRIFGPDSATSQQS